jgi:hypothetical protein
MITKQFTVVLAFALVLVIEGILALGCDSPTCGGSRPFSSITPTDQYLSPIPCGTLHSRFIAIK